MELLLTPPTWIALLFDKAAQSPARAVLEQDQIDDLDPGEALCCVGCKTRITAHNAAISVAGSHRHTFTNPGGFTFHIGCFGRVWSCAPVGSASSEHTWFAGYSWRIVSCGTCGEHLGWSFSRGADRFYGLILAKLIENP